MDFGELRDTTMDAGQALACCRSTSSRRPWPTTCARSSWVTTSNCAATSSRPTPRTCASSTSEGPDGRSRHASHDSRRREQARIAGRAAGTPRTAAPGGDEPPTAVDRAHRDPRGDGALVPRVLHVGHRVAGAARRPRRPQARAPPDPVLDVRATGCAPTVRTPSAPRSWARSWGTFHPHGDTAIYDALARMVQDFSLAPPAHRRARQLRRPRARRTAPAAMRYTECRLAPLAMEMLAGIDEETVDFVPNYDGSHRGARRAAGALPEPARQRLPGHRRGHGHQHPAPQPGRGHRRRHPRAREPRGHARRPHAVREGPGLPDRGARSSGARGSSTPTGPGAGLDQDARRGRDGREPRAPRASS